MDLITPDSGLLFWMVLIFGIVLFILWKFGFPIITQGVEKRTRHIDEALRLSREAEARMQELAGEQQRLLDKTRAEQTEIIREATRTREQMIAQAREEARQEADKLIEKARIEIAAEKESALREVRREVALLSTGIAERVLRKELSDDDAQAAYLNRLVDEMTSRQNTDKS